MPRPKIGSLMPAFVLPSTTGELVSSRELLGKGPIVLYFYPKDETLGCTLESCAFRDLHDEFRSAGAVVFGISPDPVDSHEKFAAHHKLSFLLLSDPERTAFAAFGVARDLFGLMIGRETFVMDHDGIVRHHVDSMFPARHVREALAAVKRLSH